jgi:hypothetical protein
LQTALLPLQCLLALLQALTRGDGGKQPPPQLAVLGAHASRLFFQTHGRLA